MDRVAGGLAPGLATRWACSGGRPERSAYRVRAVRVGASVGLFSREEGAEMTFVPCLVRCEPTPDASSRGRMMQLFARGRCFPPPAGGRSVDNAQQRADRELLAKLQPRVKAAPTPSGPSRLRGACGPMLRSELCCLLGSVAQGHPAVCVLNAPCREGGDSDRPAVSATYFGWVCHHDHRAAARP